MSPELDKKLCEDYPKIFADRNKSPQETAMCWGFECGDGWYKLLDMTCWYIQTIIDYSQDYDNPIEQVVADQVKEKYGTLRFYVHGGNEQTDELIQLAEFMSGHTCERCGNRGKINDSGWVTVRCESCKD